MLVGIMLAVGNNKHNMHRCFAPTGSEHAGANSRTEIRGVKPGDMRIKASSSAATILS